MGNIVKKCSKCGKYCAVCSINDLIDNRNNCGGTMIDTGMSFEDFGIIRKISSDDEFADAMVELKKNDIIEYNLKMSQFRNQVNQQKQQQESNVPKCPTCGSINLKKISGLSKAGSVALWGVFAAGRTSKTWHCNKCGAEW